MRILFLENHELFSKIVINQFLSEHTIQVVPTISEACSAFNESEFDLVLVDYDLDDGKGDTLIKRIREVNTDIKIIAASSHDEGNNALINAGADAVCSKMDFSKIGDIIRELLRQET